jgi:hypothetical protein
MRFLSLVLFALVVPVLLLAQQWELVRSHNVLGKTPLMVFFPPEGGDSTFYVLCAGVDANFNGQPDPEDVLPSLSVGQEESGGGVAILNISFPWGVLSFPLRPLILWQGQEATLYLPRIDRLSRFRFPPFGGWEIRGEDTLVRGGVQAVALREDTLLMSRRTPGQPDVGLLLKFLPGVGIVETLSVFNCPNIQQLLWDRARSQLIVLCEGVFGQNNSHVWFLSAAGDAVQVPVGDTGNFMLLEGDTLVVVANGSHQIWLLDPATHLAYGGPIEVGTTGYGGPREALLLTLPNGQRTLLVSTYSREVRWIDIATGQLLQTLSLTGLAEGMALRRRGDTVELWVAQAFTPSYGPDSTVAVFRLVVPSSVAEGGAGQGMARLFPSLIGEGPARVEWSLELGNQSTVEAEVFAVDGRRLLSWQLPVVSGGVSAVLPLSRRLLPAGWYTLRLRAGSRTAVVPFVVY